MSIVIDLGNQRRAADQQVDPTTAKIGFDLVDVEAEFRTSRRPPGTFQPSNSSFLVFNDLIAIEAIAEADNPAALRADLERLGLQQTTEFESVVSGLLPISAIGELGKLRSLSFARPVYRPERNVGLTTSQADPAMLTNTLRSDLGINGSGVTVGILSDSFNNLNGAAADIASGDLPAAGVRVLRELPGGGIDEGRAMAQLIHDVAPGSRLAFNTAFLGQTSFAQGILNLANTAGARVIVDDIGYLNAPMFQDGIVARAVDRVVNERGVTYFSSAGNQGRQSYESSFRGAVDSNIGRLHDFDPGPGVDAFQSMTIPVGRNIRIAFQWDQPFRSISRRGATTNLNIFLVNSAGDTVLASSVNPNIGQDPSEILAFTNDGSFGTNFNLVISKVGTGPDPGLMKYVVFGGVGRNGPLISIDEYDTQSSTIYGHANARGAIAVGAARYDQTPAFGTNPPILEPFSSGGSTPILFNRNGQRLSSPEIRQKPEIVAPDGTNTTFFGDDFEGDGFPNFFGTSAAAPHAAAVAALIKGANPGASPAVIKEALIGSAIDMGTPGFDLNTGFGLIQADFPSTNGKLASIYVSKRNTIVGGPNNGRPYQGTLTGTNGNNVMVGTSGDDIINSQGGSDDIASGIGNDTVNGGGGVDRFILVAGPGAVTIRGFANGDKLGGIPFSAVSIAQGTGADANNTLITLTASGDLLAKIAGVRANTINASDFLT